ncbi:MAG: hypothetical protein H5T86_11650, partial [Armatimonadetes bacterium]|nr:hypothetical protein [Armatimonadota bacterium]
LALTPAAVGWAWQIARRPFLPPDETVLEELWRQAKQLDGEASVRAARKFKRAFRRASDRLKDKFFWRRCKVFLFFGE